MQGAQIKQDDEVRQLAYRIWQEAGCPHGADVQHWLKAREIWLESHCQKQRRTKSSTATKPRKTRMVKKAR